MTKKVIVTGPFSTGKTTLVSNLFDALSTRGVATLVVPDVARDCPFPLNRAQQDVASVWLSTTQISRELAALSQNPDIILCDRGVPDILAHHMEVRERGGGVLLEQFRPFLEQWCFSYDIILAAGINPSLPPVHDGLREADSSYREKMGKFADQVLSDHQEICRLAHDLDTRIDQGLAAITGRNSHTLSPTGIPR